MKVLHENADELNAVLRLTIEEADYKEKVGEVLRGYRKQASVAGFRKGHVPMGMIEKMYGKAVKADEINKLLSNELYNYIQDKKLPVLGNPLPKEDEKVEDFEHTKKFEFVFNLGLAPQFTINLSDKYKFNHYKIVIDDKLIDQNVGDICKRFGQVGETDTSGSTDMLQGEFKELGKEEGVQHTSTVSVDTIDDAKEKKRFEGLKVGDSLEVNPKKISKGDTDLAAMLGIDKKLVDTIGKNFQFTVKKIYRVTPAVINQELFDKIFGKDAVKSEKEFRTKVSEELDKALSGDGDRKLRKDFMDHLIDKLKLSLPDAFLKRWLVETDKEKWTNQVLDQDYEKYAESLKWQLIENKLIEENKLKVEDQEIRDKATALIARQFAMYGQQLSKEILEGALERFMQSEQEVNGLYREVYQEKILELLKDKCSLKKKEVSYDEFVKLVTEKPSKFNLFNKFKF